LEYLSAFVGVLRAWTQVGLNLKDAETIRNIQDAWAVDDVPLGSFGS
jgi:hypothetical protein